MFLSLDKTFGDLLGVVEGFVEVAVLGGEGFALWAGRQRVALPTPFSLLQLWEGSQIVGIPSGMCAWAPLGHAGCFVGTNVVLAGGFWAEVVSGALGEPVQCLSSAAAMCQG